MTHEDPFVAEVRLAGDAFFRRFDYDVRAAMNHLRHQAQKEGRHLVSRPARRIEPASPHSNPLNK
jgi:hypothetical protein